MERLRIKHGNVMNFMPCRFINLRSRSHYDVLGVSKNASVKEIKSAFYTLSKKYHPDVVGSNNESAKKFLEIKEAYEVLKDPDQRRDYDAGLLNSRHSYQTTYGSTSSTQYSQHFHDFARRQQKNPWQSSRYNYNRDFEWWSKSNPEWSRDFERIWEKIKNDQKIRDDKANKEFYREWHRRVYEDHDRRRETRWSSSQNAWNWNEKEKTEQEKLLSEFMKIFNIAFISIMGLIIVTSFINLMRQRMNAIKSFRDVERRGDKMFPVSDRDMYNLRKIMETPPGPPPPRPSSNIWGEESLPYERYVPEYKTSYDN